MSRIVDMWQIHLGVQKQLKSRSLLKLVKGPNCMSRSVTASSRQFKINLIWFRRPLRVYYGQSQYGVENEFIFPCTQLPQTDLKTVFNTKPSFIV